MSTDASFRSKYGPYALVAGAAVGLGAEYSRQIAAHGLGLVLIDRDAGPLAATADAIRKQHGVDVQTLTVDLAGADVAERVLAGLGGAESGCSSTTPRSARWHRTSRPRPRWSRRRSTSTPRPAPPGARPGAGDGRARRAAA